MALPVPVGRQREVVYLPAQGHQVILGTAGSGKTSMAILRAAQLSSPGYPGSGRTLVITFNKTLSSYIRFLATDLLNSVTVENFHHFARGYLKARGLMGRSDILPTERYRSLVTQAVAEVANEHDPHAFFSRPISFFEEEIRWLSRHGIASEAEYEAVSRTGRADARLPRGQRPPMWQVRERYRSLRMESGYRYDVDEIAVYVADALDGDTGTRHYKHIIVDEGQDLSPTMLRALAKAVPTDGSFTFFGDVAQQIYGQQMTWRSAGLNPPKVWKFEENYRNTKAIANLAVAISNMPYYAGEADLVVPKQPAADGAKPTLVSFGDEDKEAAFVVDLAQRSSKTRSVAILTRTNAQAKVFKRMLPASRLLSGDMKAWNEEAGVAIGTLHNGKGLEFDTVILPYVSDALFPHPLAIDNDGLEAATASEGRLLYVGVTRARTALILTHCGERTTLLPTERALFTELSR
ncbi:3'-5' exonuclease [Bosea beijingensis]